MTGWQKVIEDERALAQAAANQFARDTQAAKRAQLKRDVSAVLVGILIAILFAIAK